MWRSTTPQHRDRARAAAAHAWQSPMASPAAAAFLAAATRPPWPAVSPVAPAGFRLAAAAPAEVATGSALLGRAVLFHWPSEGWVRGTVTRRSRAAGISHVVKYRACAQHRDSGRRR